MIMTLVGGEEEFDVDVWREKTMERVGGNGGFGILYSVAHGWKQLSNMERESKKIMKNI